MQSNTLNYTDSSTHAVHVKNSIERFGRIEDKILKFDGSTIETIIQLVEESIMNNHHRKMGFDGAKVAYPDRKEMICDEISRETKYLAGTVLPILYQRQEELGYNR